MVEREAPSWTVPRLEGFFAVSRVTVYRWLRTGQLRGYRTPGGHWRVPDGEVQRLVGREPEARTPERT